MRTREVGTTGRHVGEIGLGCMGMSWAYAESTRDDAASRDVVRAAVDAGVTFIDTADVYGDGHNETLVGAALSGLRDTVFLATKAGLVVDDMRARSLRRDGSPEHLRAAVDASLKRLGTDHIDLWYLHRVDDTVPLVESWAAMAEMVRAGKVRHLGLSEVTVEQAAAAAAVHPVTAVQSELSLWTRDALGQPAPGAPVAAVAGGGASDAGDVVGWCAANGAAFVPFAPLGRGFLTGAIDATTRFEENDLRAGNPRFTSEARASNARIVDTVRAVADRHGATPAQVAIAWVLAQGPHVVPIPGTRRLGHLADNVGAADVTLTAADLAALDAAPTAVGTRY
ncbi:Predicted oxidoreductase [Micromonospora citrea]|uniref:Predicted oxidoreductase n=1 Tax=Micromonospora citrea TaxID=47855 RepID=A0A1C6VX73_9ACTN|nr:aldo/keto reductase [Micromonospora citrea]SCL70951.1 Predicted oxidoreductase [Micromonospora citrea]